VDWDKIQVIVEFRGGGPDLLLRQAIERRETGMVTYAKSFLDFPVVLDDSKLKLVLRVTKR
jgi:hypothetical protein